MGACDFYQKAKGKTPNEAFENAKAYARHQHGHGGYTGTIAEKGTFTVIAVPEGTDPRKYAQTLIENDDKRVNAKYGPAGCVKLADGEYYFFGWASS